VQNKLTLSKFFTLSGKNLLLGLGLGLSLFALILDGIANRIFNIGSLTLPLILCYLATVSLGYWSIPILRRLKAKHGNNNCNNKRDNDDTDDHTEKQKTYGRWL